MQPNVWLLKSIAYEEATLLGLALEHEHGSANAVSNANRTAATAQKQMETATANFDRVAELKAHLEKMAKSLQPRRTAAKIARDYANEIRAVPKL